MIALLFASLRTRVFAMMIAASLSAAVLVAWGSLHLGRRWAVQDVGRRFRSMEQTLRQTTFPLTGPVLDSVAAMTETELVSVSSTGRVQSSTLPRDPADFAALESALAELSAGADPDLERPRRIVLADRSFLVFRFRRRSGNIDLSRTAGVAVLFDQSRIDAASRRAAMLPLITGLSTIALLGSMTAVLSRRLIGRLIGLQQRVEQIAGGQFQTRMSDTSPDELGRLSRSVDSMAGQLDQLWNQLQRQQSERLLHQIAGGMAHQLRNTLTGARMAIELHRQRCAAMDGEATSGDEMQVALQQLESAENYVHRLLLAAAGKRERPRPVSLAESLRDIRDAHRPIAKHLQVDFHWRFAPPAMACQVADGPSFVAAVSNLIFNAIQAGRTVWVESEVTGDPAACIVRVIDDGPGPEPSVAATLFEPFVTSKPEGMGLGLPLVRRTAEQLGGDVRWRREGDRTVFEFRCRVGRYNELTRIHNES